jgi:hypothetical protein
MRRRSFLSVCGGAALSGVTRAANEPRVRIDHRVFPGTTATPAVLNPLSTARSAGDSTFARRNAVGGSYPGEVAARPA